MDAADSAGSALSVARVERQWREAMREASARGDRAAHEVHKSWLSQLHEWRRRRAAGAASAPLAAALGASIQRLLSLGAPAGDGALAPRTQGDALAEAGNTPVLTLLGLLAATQQRLDAAARPPASASRSLAEEVARGLHGGPGVPNERAMDVGRLAAAASAAAAAPAQRAAAAAAAAAAGVCQLSVDVDVASSLCARGGLRQAAEVFVRVWDARSGEYLSCEAAIEVGPDGRAVRCRRSEEEGSSGVAWAQALFLNLPRSAIASGKCHVLFRLFRKGGLKDDGGAGAAAAAAAAPPSAAAPAPAAAGGSASGGFSGLLSRLMGSSRDDAAEYLRPVAVALLPIPAALVQLSDGSPHAPSAKLLWMRPAKQGEEVRFSTLHLALASEASGGSSSSSSSSGSSSSSSSTATTTSSTSSSSSSSNISSSSASTGGAGNGVVSGAGAGAGGASGSSSSSAAALGGSGVAALGEGLAAEEGVRHPGLDALPVVLRCYSTLPLPTLLDARYSSALSAGVRGGACVLPFSHARVFGEGEDPRQAAADEAPSLAGAEPSLVVGSEGRGASEGVSPRGREAAEARRVPRVALFNSIYSGIDVLDASAAAAGAGAEPPSLESLAHLVHPNVVSITIRKGAFSQDAKMSPRNVQVRARVVTDQGQAMACLLRPVQASPLHGPAAAAPPLLTEWHSAVFYHAPAPSYDATFAVSIPSAGLLTRAHLQLTFWHASTSSAKTHMFSFAYLPLTDSSGVALRDGVHSLPCFQPLQGLEASLHPSAQPFMPWYLVAPIISAEGVELQRPAQWHISAAAASESLAACSSGRLSPHHAAQARTRSLPATARPQSLVQVLSGATPEEALPAASDSASSAASLLRWSLTATQQRLALQQMWRTRTFSMLSGGGGSAAAAAAPTSAVAAAAAAAAAVEEGADGEGALPPSGSSSELLEPLELRPKDSIEVQTRLLSLQRASLKECHTVATWRDVLPGSPATLVDALCTLQRLPSCPDLLLREFSGLLRSLCGLLGALSSGELTVAALGDGGPLMPNILSEAFSLLVTLLNAVDAGGLYPAAFPPHSAGSGSRVPAGLLGMRSPALHSSYAGAHAMPSLLASVPLPPTLHATLFPIMCGLAEALLRCPAGTGAGEAMVSPLPAPLPCDITLPVKRLFTVWRVWGTLLRLGSASATLALAEAPTPAQGEAVVAQAREAMLRVLCSGLGVLRLRPATAAATSSASPPWVLLLQACVLRTLPEALDSVRCWLTSSEAAFVVHLAISLPSVRHWSLVLAQPSAGDAPACLRLSTLVLLRGVLANGVLDFARSSASGQQGLLALTTAAVRLLAAQVNESDLQRALCTRLFGALLERHEALLKQGTAAAALPEALAQQGRALFSLVGEMCKALRSLLLRRSARGEGACQRLASLSPTSLGPAAAATAAALPLSAGDGAADLSLLRRRACLPMYHYASVGSIGDRERLLLADPLLKWDLECRGLPGGLVRELGSEAAAPAAGSSGADEGSSSPPQGAWATAPLRSVAAAAWLAVTLNALPLGVSPSLAPFPLMPEVSGGEGSLLGVTTSLLHSATLLLSSRVFPPAWAVLHHLVHTCAVRTLAYCGSVLASAHRGTAEDDAQFLPLYALRCAAGGEGGPPAAAAAAPGSAAPLSWAPAHRPWVAFIRLTLALLTSPWMAARDAAELALPRCDEDRRPHVCAIFRAAWGEGAPGAAPEAGSGGPCASLCLALAPHLISPMLDLTHCRNPETAALARDVYIDLIGSELRLSAALAASPAGAASAARGLPEMERLTLDALDTLVLNLGPTLVPSSASAFPQAAPPPQHASAAAYRLSPNNLIMSLFATSAGSRRGSVAVAGDAAPGPASPGAPAILGHETVKRFLREIRGLYAMLSYLAHYPRTPEYEYERTRAARRLIEYLRSTHRYDMYARYVTYLTDLHRRLGNAPEAALSFLLHADVLQWRAPAAPAALQPELMPPVRDGEGRLVFSQQSPSARLESVLTRALGELRAADCWEEACRVAELLALRYEHGGGDFAKLAGALRAKAAICEAIARDERLFPSYFVVRYNTSATFPRALRGRICVVRGRQGEWIADFEERMLKKWAGAAKKQLTLGVTGGLPKPSAADAGAEGGVAEEEEEEDEEEWEEEWEEEQQQEAAAAAAAASAAAAAAPLQPSAEGSCAEPGQQQPSLPSGGGAAALLPLPRAKVSKPPALSFSAVKVCDGIPRDVVGTALQAILRAVGRRAASQPGPAPAAAAAALAAAGGSSLRRASSGALRRASTSKALGPAPAAPAAATLRPRHPPSLPEALHDPSTLWLAGPAAAGLSALPPVPALLRASAPEFLALHEAPSDREAPALVRTGREHSGARVFMHQRPVRVRSAKSDNEFLDAWVERSYLVTAEAFPTTQRTSRVVHVRTLRLNPVEVAVLELSKKTQALMEQAEAAAAGPDRGASQAFSQLLSGCVDAAVAGGVVNYAPLFTDAYKISHPEIAADLEAEVPPGSGLRPKEGLVARALLPALDAHTRALRWCTAVHANKCSQDMLPLHTFLEGRLRKLLDKTGEWGIGSSGASK